MSRLDGLTVVITGAARGIGLATARAAGREGARVWGLDVAPTAEPSAFHDFALVDLTDDTQLESYLGSFTNAAPDGLVNNAVVSRAAPFLDVTAADLDRALAVNVRAPFHLSQRLARAMAARGSGSIVNLSSVNAERGVTGSSAYSMTKGAIAALTRAMAVELAGSGVRVNAVAPAATDTEKFAATIGEDARAARLARIPMRRLATPEDVAEAIVFLLSARSSFITGHTLAVDGGYLAYGT